MNKRAEIVREWNKHVAGIVPSAYEVEAFALAIERQALERAALACENFSGELVKSGKTKAISAARVSALTCALEIRALIEDKK